MRVQDGTGQGHEAKVDVENNLHTRSIRVHESLHAALHFDQYGIGTGPITLTTATESALMYGTWTNTSKHMILLKQIFSFGLSTGGSGQARIRIIRNPTGGTLISAGTAIVATNNNFGSGLQASATYLKGAQGSTVTGGTNIIDVGVNTSSLLAVDDVQWVIPNSSSYAIAITPPTGNTSMKVYLHDKFMAIDPDNF